MKRIVQLISMATLVIGLTLFTTANHASAITSGSDNVTCWKGKNNPTGTGGNKQCKITEVPGQTTGTAEFSHLEGSGGSTTAVSDGTVTYSQATGDQITSTDDGMTIDHIQFSADGKTMTHTQEKFNKDGKFLGQTQQVYDNVRCSKIKDPKPAKDPLL